MAGVMKRFHIWNNFNHTIFNPFLTSVLLYFRFFRYSTNIARIKRSIGRMCLNCLRWIQSQNLEQKSWMYETRLNATMHKNIERHYPIPLPFIQIIAPKIISGKFIDVLATKYINFT